ncbi:MAG: hypothetical protein FWF08_07355 [Oscillospiraceae bacterium]|nr:hypothetical protein [Oscillospiraceae bacterium]
MRYIVSQQLIDDILENELKGYSFPVKPAYNPRMRANGRTVAVFHPWGQIKQIKAIEVGKQDSPDRKFLVDTLLHEYLEAEIFIKQYDEPFYNKLSKSGDYNRHKWINFKIDEFFNGLEGQQ